MKRPVVGNLPEYRGIEGMSRVGYAGDLEVYINADDPGNIPHVHIRDPKDWDRFHTCVELERARYFLHEGKEDLLNSKQRKQLQEFMSSPVTIPRLAKLYQNNWERACGEWNANNSNIYISEDAEMPNYRELSV